MSRIAMDTRAQNSWKELIEKEAATRIACKLKQDEASKDEDGWFDRTKYKLNKPLTGNLPTSLKFPPRPNRSNTVEEIERLTEQLKNSGANLLSDMKPPSQNIQALLYDGFTKEEKGRHQYLKARKSENPENKYEYPLLNSFEYGWKLNEVAPEYKTPAYGRGRIVEESFYRRNGVF
ncbi:hypothetical protein BpHYR1_007695 [Brachionus plicatilis]|uniref:Sperm microtubule inner protein 1 C-terminal domain-containing protein n=1 Tax=Brachionus plicatilis TaxID=10195 RepID=A0A3M7RPQ5_BRAPC|nr:hypothetical protein BpHYR1_007695 [Brachionus plicatilis]